MKKTPAPHRELRGKLARVLNAKNSAADETATALEQLMLVGECVIAAETAPGVIAASGTQEQKDAALALAAALLKWATLAVTALGGSTTAAPTTDRAAAPRQATPPVVTSREYGRMSDQQRRDFLCQGGKVAVKLTPRKW